MQELNKQLMDAILSLDLKAVQDNLNSGADYNCKVQEYPIIFLALDVYLKASGKEDITAAKIILDTILEKQPDLSLVDKNNNTILHKLFATHNNHLLLTDLISLVEKLIALKAPIEAQNISGEKPIHLAAATGIYELVEILKIKGNASINSINSAGITPLMLAIQVRNDISKEFVFSMLKMGARVKTSKKSALEIAQKTAKEDVIRLLQCFGTNHEEKETVVANDELINDILHSVNSEELNLILKAGLNVNVQTTSGTPLISAAIYAQKLELVKILLVYGANLHTEKYDQGHPLVALTMSGNEEFVELVCNAVKATDMLYEINRCSESLPSPVYIALQQGYIGIAKVLIENGAKLTIKKPNEQFEESALEEILQNYKLDIIKNSLKINHADVFAEIQEEEYDSVYKNYDFEDIRNIEADYKKIYSILFTNKEILKVMQNAHDIISKKLYLVEQLQLGHLKNMPAKNLTTSTTIKNLDFVQEMQYKGYITENNVSARVCYDILELYYKPLNEKLDMLLSTQEAKDNLKKRKQELEHVSHKAIITALHEARDYIGKDIEIPFGSSKRKHLNDILDIFTRSTNQTPIASQDIVENLKEDINAFVMLKHFVDIFHTVLEEGINDKNPEELRKIKLLDLQNLEELLDSKKSEFTGLKNSLISNRLSLFFKEVVLSKKELHHANTKISLDEGLRLMSLFISYVKEVEGMAFNLWLFSENDLNIINSYYKFTNAIDTVPDTNYYNAEGQNLSAEKVSILKRVFEVYGQVSKYQKHHVGEEVLEQKADNSLLDSMKTTFNFLRNKLFTNKNKEKLEQKVYYGPSNLDDSGEEYSDNLSDLWKNEFAISQYLDLNYLKPDKYSLTKLFDILKNNRSDIKYIRFEEEKNLTPEQRKAFFSALKFNKTLKSINMSSNTLSDEAIIDLADVLGKNRTLKFINLSENKIEDKGIELFATSIKDNGVLESIDLKFNKIKVDGAKSLASILRGSSNLHSLDLSDNFIKIQGTEEIAVALENNNKLKFINLTNNYINDKGAQCLALSLRNNNTLEYIGIGYNKLTDSAAKDFALALTENVSLKYIELNNNLITSEGATAIFNSLENNKTIELVDLRHNDIADEAMKATAVTLKVNNTLKYVDFSYNSKITDSGVVEIFEALQANRKLETIKFNGAQVTDKVFKTIATTLATNTILKNIALNHNQITDAGVIDLVKGLEHKETSLQSIDLSHNQISDAGAKHLAELLVTNNVERINLGNNLITDVGAEYIANALQGNTTLKSIVLDHNKITNVGIAKLAKALQNNTTLKSFDYSHNQVEDSILPAIVELLKHNDTLVKVSIPLGYKEYLRNVFSEKYLVVKNKLNNLREQDYCSDVLVALYQKLVQIKCFVNISGISMEQLDLDKKTIIDKIYRIDTLDNRIECCETLYRLHLIEKDVLSYFGKTDEDILDSFKNLYKKQQEKFVSLEVYTPMQQVFDKLLFEIIDSLTQEGLKTHLYTQDQILRLLKLLNIKDLNTTSVVDKYNAQLSFDSNSVVILNPDSDNYKTLANITNSLCKKINLGGIDFDDEKNETSSLNYNLHTCLTNEESLKELLLLSCEYLSGLESQVSNLTDFSGSI